jgi:hypothetical protein
MSRFAFIAVWTISLALIPLMIYGLFLFLLKCAYPDPPTQIAFLLGMVVMFIGAPVFGLVGLTLGLFGFLPGTRKKKSNG